jgi:hypothetical protein
VIAKDHHALVLLVADGSSRAQAIASLEEVIRSLLDELSVREGE